MNKAENKWSVFYSHNFSEYKPTDYITAENQESIYFSTREIAQKCCDWLNADCPEE